MSNKEIDRQIAKAHEEVATRNSRIAIKQVSDLDARLSERVRDLEAVIIQHNNEISQLNNKYNLLLTKNFNGGSTSN